MSRVFKIVRFYQGSRKNLVIKRGLTEAEAQAHCALSESSSRTATSAEAKRHTNKCGAWFDGYNEDR